MRYSKANKRIVRQKQAVACVDRLTNRLGNLYNLENVRYNARRCGKTTSVATIMRYAYHQLIPTAYKEVLLLVGVTETKRFNCSSTINDAV